MARERIQLQQLLETLGAAKVYFQPPNGLKMEYPCIVYRKDDEEKLYADNITHRITIRYLITVIDRNVDSEIPKKVSLLPMCAFNRFYIADNLNHNVYSLYF